MASPFGNHQPWWLDSGPEWPIALWASALLSVLSRRLSAKLNGVLGKDAVAAGKLIVVREGLGDEEPVEGGTMKERKAFELLEGHWLDW